VVHVEVHGKELRNVPWCELVPPWRWPGMRPGHCVESAALGSERSLEGKGAGSAHHPAQIARRIPKDPAGCVQQCLVTDFQWDPPSQGKRPYGAHAERMSAPPASREAASRSCGPSTHCDLTCSHSGESSLARNGE